MLRVVGGKYKRRKLDQPSLEITRPTKDMVKEAMFSSLGDMSGKSFLDCFGGSGAIGIEAYSRGATPVTIVENSLEAFKIIKTNLKNLNINDINVIYKDFKKVVETLNLTFDYIFIDPPYLYEINDDFFNKLVKFNVINQNTTIIIERDKKISLNIFNEYNVKEYKYGKTYLYILRKE